jgi:macrodomain Ter protein organizer (MatP/YcbG family)
MITKRNDLLSKKVIQSLKNRHMNGYYVHSKQEAVDLGYQPDVWKTWE